MTGTAESRQPVIAIAACLVLLALVTAGCGESELPAGAPDRTAHLMQLRDELDRLRVRMEIPGLAYTVVER